MRRRDDGVKARTGAAAGVALLAGMAALLFASSAFALTFGPPIVTGGVDSPVGTDANPQSVATADFNDDSFADIATANVDTDNVSIRLGHGLGGFDGSTAITLPTGAGPVAVVAGDFNRDGHPDVATANRDGDSVSVALGHGDGTFASPATVQLPVNATPRGLVVADLDRDGDQDLATANSGTNNVSALRNNGAGAMTVQPSGFTVGTTPVSIASGDFNSDGILDLVTANNASGDVSLLLGNGSAGFGAAQSTATAGNPIAVEVADLDNDGDPDVVEAAVNGGAGSLTRLLGDGSGGLSPPSGVALTNPPQSLTVADFNKDGNQDAAVGNSTGVSLRPGNGSGGFGSSAFVPLAGAHPGIAPADFDGDGNPDLVTANDTSDNVTALLGAGNGTLFGRHQDPTSATVDTADHAMVAALFNADGNLDLATAAHNAGNTAFNLNLGAGGGALNASTLVSMGAGGAAHSIATGDFNEDGKVDVVVAKTSADKFTLALGNGNGTFGTATDVGVGDAPISIAVGDFDHDANQDVATSNLDNNTITVRWGNGNGTFAATAATLSGFANNFSIDAADVDNDGDSDLALLGTDNVSFDQAIFVFKSNGAGRTFAAPAIYGQGVSFAGADEAIRFANLDSNSSPDIVTANSGSNNSVSVLLNQGSGTFGSATTYPSGPGAWSVETGDLDGDGHNDVVVPDTNSPGTVAVLHGSASGALSAPDLFATAGDNPRAVVTGDLNGDGLRDIAVGNVGTVAGTSNISVLLNKVDTSAPETAIEMHPDATTPDPTPSFTFSATEVGSSFQCSVDTGTPTFGACSGPQLEHTAASLANGSYTFRVRATDRTGNVDPTPATFDFTVNAPPPPAGGGAPPSTPPSPGPQKKKKKCKKAKGKHHRKHHKCKRHKKHGKAFIT